MKSIDQTSFGASGTASGSGFSRCSCFPGLFASLATTAQLWASPVTVLARSGLGTPERSAYQQQLDGSGIVELKNAALLAVATNNKVLGAALVSILDRMPARSRPFSAQDLADKLVGAKTRQVQDAIIAVKLAAPPPP